MWIRDSSLPSEKNIEAKLNKAFFIDSPKEAGLFFSIFSSIIKKNACDKGCVRSGSTLIRVHKKSGSVLY